MPEEIRHIIISDCGYSLRLPLLISLAFSGLHQENPRIDPRPQFGLRPPAGPPRSWHPAFLRQGKPVVAGVGRPIELPSESGSLLDHLLHRHLTQYLRQHMLKIVADNALPSQINDAPRQPAPRRDRLHSQRPVPAPLTGNQAQAADDLGTGHQLIGHRNAPSARVRAPAAASTRGIYSRKNRKPAIFHLGLIYISSPNPRSIPEFSFRLAPISAPELRNQRPSVSFKQTLRQDQESKRDRDK
jgi:hypothetical protein